MTRFQSIKRNITQNAYASSQQNKAGHNLGLATWGKEANLVRSRCQMTYDAAIASRRVRLSSLICKQWDGGLDEYPCILSSGFSRVSSHPERTTGQICGAMLGICEAIPNNNQKCNIIRLPSAFPKVPGVTSSKCFIIASRVARSIINFVTFYSPARRL